MIAHQGQKKNKGREKKGGGGGRGVGGSDAPPPLLFFFGGGIVYICNIIILRDQCKKNFFETTPAPFEKVLCGPEGKLTYMPYNKLA